MRKPYIFGSNIKNIIEDDEVGLLKEQGSYALPMVSMDNVAKKSFSYIITKNARYDGDILIRLMMRDGGVYSEKETIVHGDAPVVLARGDRWYIAISPAGLEYPETPSLTSGLNCSPIRVLDYGDESSAITTLKKAINYTSSCSFSCDFNDAPLLDSLQAKSGKYYKYVADDGFVFRKIELKNDNGTAFMSIVGNRDGVFYEYEREWQRVLEVLPLWYFDNMLEWFSLEELSLCDFSMSDVTIAGKEYKEISVSTPKDLKRLFDASKGDLSLDWFTSKGAGDFTSDFYNSRPMLRKFIIGANDGIIYSRKHYNIRNECIFIRELNNADIQPVFDESFFMAGKTDGIMKFEFMDSYYEAKTKMIRKTRGKNKMNSPYSRIIVYSLSAFLFANVVIVLFCKHLKKTY